MNIDFTGQRALVTGGTRGIGREIVRSLVDSGADVVATGKEAESLRMLFDTPKVTPLKLDLSDLQAADELCSRLEGEHFDVLVNNAGINIHAPVGELDMEEFNHVLDVNLRGAVVISRALVPGMARRGYGRVVSITSIFSMLSKPQRASYATSKFALLGFTRSLALDYAETGVLANCIAPGFIATDMTERQLGPSGIREIVAQVPIGRLGTCSEVAALVLFVASSLNTFMTGQNIFIDGGFSVI